MRWVVMGLAMLATAGVLLLGALWASLAREQHVSPFTWVSVTCFIIGGIACIIKFGEKGEE